MGCLAVFEALDRNLQAVVDKWAHVDWRDDSRMLLDSDSLVALSRVHEEFRRND